MNWGAQSDESLLEFRHRKIHVFRICEARMSSGQSLDFVKVIGLIGRDPKNAVVHKCAMNGIEKLIRDDPATMMPTFWPRIREEQVKCLNRRFRQQIPNRVTALYVENANISEIRRLPTGFGDAACQFLDPKEIAVRTLRSQVAQERAVAAAEIHLQRRVASENGEKIERTKECFRDQFDHGIKMGAIARRFNLVWLLVTGGAARLRLVSARRNQLQALRLPGPRGAR